MASNCFIIINGDVKLYINPTCELGNLEDLLSPYHYLVEYGFLQNLKNLKLVTANFDLQAYRSTPQIV